MASKQERRHKEVGVIKCKACQTGSHEQCANLTARHVRICDCMNGAHHEQLDRPA